MPRSHSRRQFLDLSTHALGAAALTPLLTARAAEAPTAITHSELGLGYAQLLQGAGCNVVALPGMSENGVLLIDGGLAAHAPALLQAAFDATGQQRVHTLINTHFHPEQTGANEAVGMAGGSIIAHENTALCLKNAVLSSTYKGRYGPLAQAGIPTQLWREDGSFTFAGQEIIHGYLPAAHTNGDIFVFFPILDLLVTGGPVTTQQWPILDIRQGGWMGGLVRAYDKLSQVVSADTVVVPAHGPITNGTALIRMRNMYSELHLRLAEELNIGMGWDDVVAKKLLAPFEAQYGNADAFVEAAFRSLQLAYVPD
ncbi:MAG: MBL fold metallo-hydrolase [Pseudomonadales bacterium]|jgi:glyoxylase-like metal-dependent hydrolase (beta-lactamase superfamily II)|nr:MBL fold metallo-hydrolase [Pseudomonadales bacterium]